MSDSDDDLGNGWRDELDEALRRALARGPLRRHEAKVALCRAMGVDHLDDDDVEETAARIGAMWDGDVLTRAPTPIHAVVERATTPQEWIAARALALQAGPETASDAEVIVLVTNQPHAADNGAWLIGPSGSHRRVAAKDLGSASIEDPREVPAVTAAVGQVMMWFLIARNPKTPEHVEFTADPAADPWIDIARRARCVDGKLDEVLAAAKLFPGDIIDITPGGLFFRRKTAAGEETHHLGEVHDWLSLIDSVCLWLKTDDLRWLLAAWNHASTAHTNQRYGNEPYVVHLAEVFGVLASINRAGGALGPAALLHDTVEDTLVTREELEELFGYEVARLVHAVSKDKGPRSITVPASNAKIREDCRASGNDHSATLKLADKIANVRRSRRERPDLFAMYAAEQPDFSAALEEEGLGDPRLWAMLRTAFDA